jgi:hypothetical protein
MLMPRFCGYWCRARDKRWNWPEWLPIRHHRCNSISDFIPACRRSHFGRNQRQSTALRPPKMPICAATLKMHYLCYYRSWLHRTANLMLLHIRPAIKAIAFKLLATTGTKMPFLGFILKFHSLRSTLMATAHNFLPIKKMSHLTFACPARFSLSFKFEQRARHTRSNTLWHSFSFSLASTATLFSIGFRYSQRWDLFCHILIN